MQDLFDAWLDFIHSSPTRGVKDLRLFMSGVGIASFFWTIIYAMYFRIH